MQTTFKSRLFMTKILYLTCAFVCIYVFFNYDPFSSRKRAAILQRYASDPNTASFSSATSLGAASMEGNHKRTVQLHETVWGILTPSKFNGTWVSDSDIMYKDTDGGYSVLNMENNMSYKVRNKHRYVISHFILV